MATSDILGLFATPEQYQAQQRAQDQSAALQYASMTPIQQANYGIFSGAQQLGRGVSGLLGVQDPQLQRIRQRQEIMQTINPADPDSLRSGIQRAAEGNDSELALSLTEFLNRQMSEMAQAQQRLAAAGREREQAVPADIAKARELGILTTALAQLEQTPQTPERDRQMTMLRTQISALERPEKATPDMSNAAALADLTSTDRNSDAWKQEYKSQLTRLTTKPENEKKSAFAQQLEDAGYIPGSPAYVSMMDKFLTKELTAKGDKGVSFGTDREAIAEEFFEKPFKDLTKDQKAKVNAVKEDREGTVAQKGATKLVLPGQEKPVDVPKFRIDLNTAVKPFGEIIDAGDVGIRLMNDAINTNNPSSFESARTNLARMIDPGRLTNADIERAGGDPAVLTQAKNFISRVFTSTPSRETMENMVKTMKLIRKAAQSRYDRELKTQRKIAKMANISDEQIDTLFEDIRRPEQKPAGNSKAVDFTTLPKSNP
jgi:hypothetical protein